MKTDASLILFEKYFNLKNRWIEIELKNGQKYTGKFIGYFKGNKQYIEKWHFSKDDFPWDQDQFGCSVGKIVPQKELNRVFFFDDQSEMRF